MLKIGIEKEFPTIVLELDKRFAEDIRKARRIKGDYELKNWGFEYRSLPNTLDVLEVSKFAFGILQKNTESC
jgi:hypothetical protein